jgi:hypothetical protein
MAATNPQNLSKLAQQALYVTVGLGVIAFQKAQVQRHGLQKRFEDRIRMVEERVGSLVSRGAA